MAVYLRESAVITTAPAGHLSSFLLTLALFFYTHKAHVRF